MSFMLHSDYPTQPKLWCHGQKHPTSLDIKEVFRDYEVHALVPDVWMVTMFHSKPAGMGATGPICHRQGIICIHLDCKFFRSIAHTVYL